MRIALVAVACVALAAGRLPGQNPAQTVFAACPSSSTVFSERAVQVPAKFVGDTTISPAPVLRTAATRSVVSFVVDTLGVPERSSLVAVNSTDTTLVAMLAPQLSRWRFSPALASGCRVRQRVVTAVR
jgi:hypothetical protein